MLADEKSNNERPKLILKQEALALSARPERKLSRNSTVSKTAGWPESTQKKVKSSC
jgi:hypothetical protein